MTFRFSAAARPDRCLELRVDGRWARLLAALGRGAHTAPELLEATDTGRYPRWRERNKIHAALRDMRGLGWVRIDGRIWTRTPTGAAALQSALDANVVRRDGEG